MPQRNKGVRRNRRAPSHPARQPKDPNGPRLPIGAAVTRAIETAIQRECARYHVSRSFVIAVALAYTFKIDLDDPADYHKRR